MAVEEIQDFSAVGQAESGRHGHLGPIKVIARPVSWHVIRTFSSPDPRLLAQVLPASVAKAEGFGGAPLTGVSTHGGFHPRGVWGGTPR